MKLSHFSRLGAIVALLTLGALPAFAADNSLTGKNASGVTVTFCGKDIGGGIMASCSIQIDTAGTKITPAKDSSVDGLESGVGAQADPAWSSGSGSMISILKTIAGAALDTSPATVQISQTTTANDVDVVSSALPTGAATAANQTTANSSLSSMDTKLSSVATAANQTTANSSLASIDTRLTACTPGGAQSAASTNATNIKASAGTFCGGVAVNTTATIYYLRLYNLATAPTCSSSTGFVTTIPIPASASGNGTLLNLGPFGAAFSAGIGFCITGGGSSTDNTSAATGVYVSYTYK